MAATGDASGPEAASLTTRCTIIAEVAQAHDGSLGTAHAYVDAAARWGADGIKFQTHIAAAESTPAEPWRVKFSRQDASRFDYWRRMEFTEEQWQGLHDHAKELGLLFLSSPFSIDAVELLERVGVDMWKIASGEVNNLVLLERILDDGRPVILSSGMSTIAELDTAVEMITGRGVEVTVLQCTTAYPCPPEKLGLNLISELRDRYRVPIGLSDHSGTIYGGVAGAALGIEMLEIHVTFSRDCFGPDVPASVTFPELRQLVDGIRFVETALGSAVDKEAMSAEMAPLRSLFTRSIVIRRDMGAGETIEMDDVALKKPGSGMPPDLVPTILGRRLARAIAADTLLSEDDLESAR